MDREQFPFLGIGVGLRPPHYDDIFEESRKVAWFEAISENYIGIDGGAGARPLRTLEKIRANTPVVLHGVSLSIGSTDPLDRSYLERLKTLIARIEPAWISDHLCWTGVAGENLHDLLPLPYTEETLDHLVPRIRAVQDILRRPILLENVSSYLSFRHSTMTEWEFISEVAERADCGLLLDVNNIYVSARNQRFDALDFLNGIDPLRVGQMHLAGHSDRGNFLIDTHDGPVCDEVWKLYEKAVARFGAVSTLIEWDDSIPPFAELVAEARKAERILEAASV